MLRSVILYNFNFTSRIQNVFFYIPYMVLLLLLPYISADIVNNGNPGEMAISHCFPSCSHAHLIPWKPPNTSYLPLWHYLQTAADSCLFAPPSQCATHCHSASALRTASLVLCLSWRRGGRGFKIINYKGNAAPFTTPTQTGIVFRQLETTKVEKTCIFDAHQFSWYRKNSRGGDANMWLLLNKNSFGRAQCFCEILWEMIETALWGQWLKMLYYNNFMK